MPVLINLINQRNAIDPFAYLRDVLAGISATPVRKFAQFLPDGWADVVAASDDAPAGPVCGLSLAEQLATRPAGPHPVLQALSDAAVRS